MRRLTLHCNVAQLAALQIPPTSCHTINKHRITTGRHSRTEHTIKTCTLLKRVSLNQVSCLPPVTASAARAPSLKAADGESCCVLVGISLSATLVAGKSLRTCCRECRATRTSGEVACCVASGEGASPSVMQLQPSVHCIADCENICAANVHTTELRPANTFRTLCVKLFYVIALFQTLRSTLYACATGAFATTHYKFCRIAAAIR